MNNYLYNLKVKTTNSEIVVWVLTFMLWFNFFFTFFPANRGSFLWYVLSSEDAYNTIWIRFLTFINFVGSIFVIVLQRKIKKSNILIFLFLLWVFFLISKVLNTLKGDIIGIFAIPIEYFTFYIILKEYTLPKKTLKIILWLSSLWIIIPIAMFLLGPIQMKLSLISFDQKGRAGTFGGFAIHRNYFGYYAGLIILLFVFYRTKKWIKLLVIFVGLIGIFISTSRSAFLCLFLSLSVFGWLKYKRYRLLFSLGLLLVGLGYYLLSLQIQFRSGDITSTSDREELIEAFSDSISYNPILGKGRGTLFYSSSYPQGAQAHNFIMQVWCDYGIIVLIFFCLYWGSIFIYGNIIVKTFIAYLMSFGLFQPYFMLNLPPPFIWMNIFFISLISEKGRLRPLKRKLIYYDRDNKK